MLKIIKIILYNYLLIIYIMSDSIDSQQNNEQLLNDIQSLQTIEKQLFDSLETNPNFLGWLA